jgi:hypothetical protein
MFKVLLGFGLAIAAYGAVARPGTINYAEGDVKLEGQPVASEKLGSAEVAPGQVLETGNGKAEMLLTPGVFLRLGDQSAVRMVSPSLTDIRVELVRGKAMIEADLLQKENRLGVRDNGATVQIDKKGIYEFNAAHPGVAVYDGKAIAQIDDRTVEVGKGKELALQPSDTLKPQKFDRKETDELYAWSKLRSEYLAEANASSAQTVVVNNPGWWAGTGWYWNPWYSTWAFLPGSGFLYNPWGFGFYSPAYFYYNPPIYYYPRPGVAWRTGGRPVAGGRVGRPSAIPRSAAPAARPAPAMRPAPAGGGVRFGAGRRR